MHSGKDRVDRSIREADEIVTLPVVTRPGSQKGIECRPRSFALARLGPPTNDQRIAGASGRNVEQPTLFSLEIAKLLGFVIGPASRLRNNFLTPTELTRELEVS